MLKAYGIGRNGPTRLDLVDGAIPPDAVWLDLIEPTREEEHTAEAFLGFSVPTLEEAQEIEFSSRFYEEDGGIYMTASILAGVEEAKPDLTPLTFILGGGRLATIRYREFRAVGQFLARASKPGANCTDAPTVFLAFLEAIIDRLADVVERSSSDIDHTSREIFRRDTSKRQRRLDWLVNDVGHVGDLVSKIRECLSSLERLLQFASAATTDLIGKGRNRNRIKLMQRDVRSLADQVTFLNTKVNFLLDATLGLISTQQNEVIRVLTVVSIFFFPPTLIGTIYGMNFHNMPELNFQLGYPTAILLMVLSAVLPYFYFKRRGWL